MKREFPKGFLWGASTASHQVEGGTKNQWWDVLMDLKRYQMPIYITENGPAYAAPIGAIL